MTAAVIPYRTIAVETIRQAGLIVAILTGLWVTLSGITKMPNRVNAIIAQNAVTNSRIDDTNRKLDVLICLNAQLKSAKQCLADGNK